MKKQFTKLCVVTTLLLLVASTAVAVVSPQVGDFAPTATGNWTTDNTNWMQWDGSGWNTTPAGAPTTIDNVWILDGQTITIVGAANCNNLKIGQSGTACTLTFDGVAARAVVVTGSITIATNGTFIVQSTGTFTNTMSVSGNITNNGTFDMSRNSSTTVCTVTFNGTGEQDISGTTPVLTRFRGITLTKSSKTDPVKSTIDTQFGGSNLLVLTTGTWEQNAGNLINLSGSQTLGSINGVLLIDGSGGYTNYNGVAYTAASLAVNVGGTFTVNTSGTVQIGIGNNSVTTGGTINLTAGTVRIFGKFVITTGTTTINGANVYTDPNPTFTGATALSTGGNQFEVSGTTGIFNFTSGSVTLCNPLTSPAAGRDLKITSTGTVNITNGIFYIGDGVSTQASSGSAIYNGFVNGSSVAIPNVVVQTGGIAGRNFGLKTNLPVSGTLTIKSGIVEQAVASATRLDFGATGTLAYNGTSAQTSTDIEFPTTGGPINLIINNSSGVNLHAARTLNGTLTLTSGTLATGANALTLKGATSGSGLINTGGTGTLTYGGTSEQTLASSNLTSGAVNNLIINAGSKLTSSGAIAATNFTINSDNTSGTGTLLDNGTLTASTANVQQFLTGLTGASTRANWYLSSPVSGATAAVFNVEGGINKMTSYNEVTTSYLAQFSSNATALVRGVGYVTYIGGADATYTFTGGNLNNGDITLTPTRTGIDAGKRGFNLVGNPYPSYLNWASADIVKTNVRSTIWYRTFSGTEMIFLTNDGTFGTGTSSAYIPPMQAFWIRVNADGDIASLKFVNSARAHQDQSIATNRLRAPKVNTAQIVRLQVSNGINNDEALIVADPNALDGFDNYDSQKMTNANVNIPEIFTLAGSEELVINRMNNLSGNKELPLGFRPGKTCNFTIEATEVSNFSNDMKVMLLDKLTGIEQELAVGSPYSFSSDATATNNRFSVLFKSPSVTTGLNNATNNQNVLVYRNLNNQITVICNQGIDDQSSVSVYNAVGQKLSNQKLAKTSTEINQALTAGVYVVTVHNGGQTVTKKVIIK